MSRKTYNLPKKTLKKLYIEQKKSLRTIGKEVGMSSNWVRQQLIKNNIERRKSTCYFNDLRNQKFNMLLVLDEQPTSYNNRMRWQCKCDCGNISVIQSDCLITGNTKSCGCLNDVKGKNNPNWKGFEDISSSIWGRIKGGAKSRDIEFNIKIEYAWEIWTNQKGRCSLSGVELILPHINKSHRSCTYNASLDRIDSKIGYVIGNIQWVCREINYMKHVFDQELFIDLCMKVADYQRDILYSKEMEMDNDTYKRLSKHFY